MNDKIYYVYQHVEPVTDQLMYIGHGCRERAWACRPGRGKTYSGGHRKPEHADWCLELMQSGCTPDDWVQIVKQGLTKDEAKILEYELINEHRPIFNYQIGDNFKLSQEQRNTAFEMRETGLYYNKIAENLGVSTMTIWRYLNG